MEDLLSLKWKNHSSTFFKLLGILRDKNLYTDVTLSCNGNFYTAHRIVLAACSEYFSEIFDHIGSKNSVIVINGITSTDLEVLLDYMYIGEANVKQSALASLVKAAEGLQIKGLAVNDDEPATKCGASKKLQSSKRKRRMAPVASDEDSAAIMKPAKSIKENTTATESTLNRQHKFFSESSDIKDQPLEEYPNSIKTEVMNEYTIEDDYIECHTPLEHGECNTSNNDFRSSISELENQFVEEHASSSITPFQDNQERLGSDSSEFPVSNYKPGIDYSQPTGRSECGYCGKSFCNAFALRRHMRTHTGEKPFACKLCSYTCNQKANLKTHIITVHKALPASI